MTTEAKDYRLDGIYVQRQDGYFMQRVKLPAGIISAGQARTVAAASERFARGSLHLTTRGSIEIHWLQEQDLAEVKRALTSTGLTSRGACGGAVRGITCASQGTVGFPLVESLARRIHRHFTGNPRFERLPKKFKIGIDADLSAKRHLIQDLGLVLNRSEDGRGWYDVWIAGGLGREPQAGILLEQAVVEERIIPLIEAVARAYTAGAEPGKRLKHLLNNIGEPELRRRIYAETAAAEELPPVKGMPEILVSRNSIPAKRIEARLFGGQLSAEQLKKAADYADAWADGVLMITVDQDIAFQLSANADPAEAGAALQQAGLAGGPQERVTFRICPGTHECKMGLTATRDAASAIIAALGSGAEGLTLALSGCPNSCTQPQLAGFGIVSSRLTADADGRKSPRFDLYIGEKDGLGQKTETGLTLEEIIAAIRLRSAVK